jgi:hypothetical protein
MNTDLSPCLPRFARLFRRERYHSISLICQHPVGINAGYAPPRRNFAIVASLRLFKATPENRAREAAGANLFDCEILVKFFCDGDAKGHYGVDEGRTRSQ